MSSLVDPMMCNGHCSEMSGTVRLGIACKMICSKGELGDVNRFMSMRRKAVEMVKPAVTGEVE